MKRHPGSSKSLAHAVAMLGLAMGAVVPMAGCSADNPGNDQSETETTNANQGADEGGATNPCAVKKKKTGPCAVGG